MKRFLLALLLLPSMALAGEVRLERAGKTIVAFTTPDDPVAAGETIRWTLDLLRPAIQPTDVLHAKGAADFGQYYAFRLPNCAYRAEKRGDAHWFHHCQIDATKDTSGKETKGAATPGFAATTARFDNFKLSAPCSNPTEDGSVIGWAGDGKLDGKLEFHNCELDGMGSADWLIYSWSSPSSREVILDNCTIKYCRFGIACASSGNPTQIITATNCTFIGDANGSRSTGETSGGDSSATVDDAHIKGGVLAAVLNRAGTTTLRDCTFQAIGLEKQYYDTRPGATYQRWTCERVANFGTDYYNANPGPTTWTIERCKSLGITPGISRVWNDVDLRGTNAIATLKLVGDPAAVRAAQESATKRIQEATAQAQAEVEAARGGSGSGGEFKLWSAAPAVK
jgi:hypothetical protein